MKPINLKNLVRAAQDLTNEENNVEYYQRVSERFPKMLESAKINLQRAKEAFADAAAPVTSALDAVQKRAKCRTMDARSIIQAIEEIEERLDIISSRTDAIGTIAEVDYNAQHFPNAYKYTPESTQITLEKKRNGWTLTYVERNKCKTPANKIVLTLTEATKAHMAERVSRIGR